MNHISAPSHPRLPGRPGKDEVDGALLLLRAAEAAFARSGFQSATIRGIAREAGVNHALISHHFGSKEALWAAVMDRLANYLAPFIAQLRRLQAQTAPPIRARVEAAFRILVDVVHGEPDCGALLSRIGAERGAAFELLADKLLRPFHGALFPILAEGQEAGVLARQDMEIFYFMVFTGVIAALASRPVLASLSPASRSLDELKDGVVDFLLTNFIQNNQRGE